MPFGQVASARGVTGAVPAVAAVAEHPELARRGMARVVATTCGPAGTGPVTRAPSWMAARSMARDLSSRSTAATTERTAASANGASTSRPPVTSMAPMTW